MLELLSKIVFAELRAGPSPIRVPVFFWKFQAIKFWAIPDPLLIQIIAALLRLLSSACKFSNSFFIVSRKISGLQPGVVYIRAKQKYSLTAILNTRISADTVSPIRVEVFPTR